MFYGTGKFDNDDNSSGHSMGWNIIFFEHRYAKREKIIAQIGLITKTAKIFAVFFRLQIFI